MVQGKADLFGAFNAVAHSTRTAIGDPTEANALGAAFRGVRSMDDPLYV